MLTSVLLDSWLLYAGSSELIELRSSMSFPQVESASSASFESGHTSGWVGWITSPSTEESIATGEVLLVAVSRVFVEAEVAVSLTGEASSAVLDNLSVCGSYS